MLGWTREKMAIQELAPRGGKFLAFGLIAVGNSTSAYSDPCVPGGDCLIAVENGFWDNAHTFDSSSKGERLGGKPNTLVQRAQCTGGSSHG
jgi:hypothetical protein